MPDDLTPQAAAVAPTAAVRVVVLHCPQWPVAAIGATGDEPVAVVHANRVVARSVAAAVAGVRVGMRRRDAQNRCSRLRVVAHEPARDAREFQQVAEAVAALVPRVELTEPGTLTFLARGPSRYFGGDAAMGRRVLDEVRAVLGRRAVASGPPGLGVADGRFAAALAARRGSSGDGVHVVAPGGSAAFLAPEPIGWLASIGAIDCDIVGLLSRLGLVTLADVARLPLADVVGRFGWQGVGAVHMARGDDDRPPGTVAPGSEHGVVRSFEPPVHQVEPLVFVGKQLAEQLHGALAAGGRVCTRLLVVAETEHGERSERIWHRSDGLDAAAMVERVRWQLDGWAGEGRATAGVIQLRLEPVEARANDGVQQGLWGGRTQADEWAQRAVARLTGLVGEQQVLVPAWRGGRRPGEAFQWVPAVLADLGDASARLGPGPRDGPWPGALPAPSPAIVRTTPQQVVVLDAEGEVVTVSGRGMVSGAPATLRRGSRDDPIVGWAGPWVLDERWWDGLRRRRMARFQIALAQGDAYLAVLERRQWWLTADYC